ncbi:MAG: hypothetical protein IJJ21_02975 [Firmicutes bacterium]|nr:hypothetical protein [Bacillota bacterium]
MGVSVMQPKTNYKLILIALDENGNVISTSKIMHTITKGSTKIIVYAANGVYKRITVTVK